ncbi:LysR family transcriptional regulator [Pseudoxanthobacter sp.]|uniref:LysR family transcriptional regulator n=1 Tax=Pseudoxanthobacter sp. TaxID=1925742 RepID=UPI002FE21704
MRLAAGVTTLGGDQDFARRPFRGSLSDSDLRLLRVFRTVVDCGGFSAAEVSLNKSKSAISLDISNLESRLGATLCQRGRAGFALTDEGQLVYLAALQLFTDLDKFRDRVSAGMRHLTGKVAVLLLDNLVSVAEAPLVEAFAAFGRQHPRVELHVESVSASGVERGILEGDAEIGISVVPRPVATLEMLPLFREELRLYCGAGHPLFAAAGPTADEILRHPLVEPSTTDDPAFVALVGSFPISSRAGSLDTRILLILSGLHLGFLPPHYAARWVERGALRELAPQTFSSSNMFHLILKKSARQTAAAQALTKSLLRAFRAAAPDGLIAGPPG